MWHQASVTSRWVSSIGCRAKHCIDWSMCAQSRFWLNLFCVLARRHNFWKSIKILKKICKFACGNNSQSNKRLSRPHEWYDPHRVWTELHLRALATSAIFRVNAKLRSSSWNRHFVFAPEQKVCSPHAEAYLHPATQGSTSGGLLHDVSAPKGVSSCISGYGALKPDTDQGLWLVVSDILHISSMAAIPLTV